MRAQPVPRVKVLHIVDTLGMGGAETWLMEVLRYLAARGPDAPQMDFLATSGNTGVFDEEALALGARIFYVPFTRSRLPAFVKGFRRLLAREQYDVLHDHQGFISGWHFLAGWGRLPPIRIAHVHSAIRRRREEKGRQRLVLAMGAELVADFASHIVGTSRQLLADYALDRLRFGTIPQVPIYCGFDTDRFAAGGRARGSIRKEFGWAADTRVILVAGRLDPWPDPADPRNWKNSAFAVSVAIEAALADPRIGVVLAGEQGPAIAGLRDRVRVAGLEHRIVFPGLRRDIERLMAGADVLLFPSRREGLGMVAVEAQAVGLPVLASTGVPRECVVSEDLVTFMDVAQGPAAWAEILLKLAARPRNSQAARELVANSEFSIARSVGKLLDLYNARSIDVRIRGPRPVSFRVLHVVDTLGMGGVETWMMELLREWRRQGPSAPQIDFVATSGNVGIFDDEAKALGSRIFYIPYTRANALGFTREFRKVLRGGQYAAIHDHQGYTSGWHFLMGVGLLPPVRVAHVHNPTIELRNMSWSRSLAMKVGKRLIRYFTTHIAGTSRQLINEYGFNEPAYARVPSAAIHCGFDAARFRGDAGAAKAAVCREFRWPETSRVVLFAGRMDESADLGHPKNHKNSGFAVSVAIECATRDPRFRMVLAGAPSAAAPVLQQRVADAGLAGRIVFAGIRRDIEHLMLASDVLLFPSESEGLGMVAVEAQAAGLPVLASAGVPRECVVSADLVRFLKVDDGVPAWADHLLELAARPRDVELGNRQVAASAFSVSHSGQVLSRLYREGVLA